MESPGAPLSLPDGLFDALTCQQGLQFFPDRPAGLKEMRRVLKANGRAAIAVWREIDRCPFFRALERAARSVDPAIADLILMPFSWPGPEALASAAKAAGFREVQVETATLPLVFEGGLEQASRAYFAMPAGPQVSLLPTASKAALLEAAMGELSKLLKEGRVESTMASNLLSARA